MIIFAPVDEKTGSRACHELGVFHRDGVAVLRVSDRWREDVRMVHAAESVEEC